MQARAFLKKLPPTQRAEATRAGMDGTMCQDALASLTREQARAGMDALASLTREQARALAALSPAQLSELLTLKLAQQDASHATAGASRPASAELLAQARAAKAECGKLHRGLNALRKEVSRELGRFSHELSALAAKGVTTTSPRLPGGARAEPEDALNRPAGVAGFSFNAVGHIESCFLQKNGTPRQAGLAPNALSRLRVRCGTNPAHSLEGLEEFSHVWLVWVFDRNGNEAVKAKVHPPRLGGQTTGLFACRTPHRPCPIGLSLVRLRAVRGDTLLLAGADLVDGTAVLDIKPFIPAADAPPEEARVPAWLQPGDEAAPRACKVSFTDVARSELSALCTGGRGNGGIGGAGESQTAPFLRFFAGLPEEAEATLADVLRNDPRSVFRKARGHAEYLVCIDGIDVSCIWESDTVRVMHARRSRLQIRSDDKLVEDDEPEPAPRE